MRLPFIGLSLVAAALPAFAAPAGTLPGMEKRCFEADVRGKATVRKLADLPPANVYHAVYRLGADGCAAKAVPVVYGLGARPKR